MRRRWTSIGIALVSCGGDPPPPDTAITEPAELAGITQRHNDVRAMVSTSDPLPPLEWDPALEATARAWAAMCRDQMPPAGLLDHNADRSVGHPYYVGENVYGASGPPGASIAQQAVALWAMEGADYDYATNTCAAGKICGHYTQVVWRATQKLGCAVADCPSLQFRATLVCNYGPGGNMVGEKPY